MNKCTKCGIECNIERRSPYALYKGICSSCEDKRKTRENWVMFFVVLLILGVVFGLRLLWAKVVYKDSRCVWAECRILK